jgi:hypothetical protein
VDDIERILAGKAPEGAPAHTAISDDDSVLVSLKIVGGADILFVYRDHPADGDSGWTLMSGSEPDSWLEDRSKFEEKTVGWALERDGSLAEILGAAPDSTFERDALGEAWVELVEE